MILNGGLAPVPPPTPPLLTLQSHPEMIDHSQLTPSLYKESQQLSPALCSFSRNLSLHTAPLFPLFLHFFCTHTHSVPLFTKVNISYSWFLFVSLENFSLPPSFSTLYCILFDLSLLRSLFHSDLNNSCYKEVIFHIYDFFLKIKFRLNIHFQI